MGFFKRKDTGPLIPPIPPTAGQQARAADPYAARSTGGAARDPYSSGGGGDPYGAAAGGNRDPYGGAGANANPYGSAGEQQNNAARNELFGGFAAPAPAVERKWGYDGREQEEDFDEDEEVEGIKQSMRQTKQDSLASTRWVVRVETVHGADTPTIGTPSVSLVRLRTMPAVPWPGSASSLVSIHSFRPEEDPR